MVIPSWPVEVIGGLFYARRVNPRRFSYTVVVWPVLTVFSIFAMHTFLIIVPEGGMLFEAAGIADILMQANRLSPVETPLYQIAVATTQSHRVVHGLSGLSLLADHRLADLDPALPRDERWPIQS